MSIFVIKKIFLNIRNTFNYLIIISKLRSCLFFKLNSKHNLKLNST